MPLNIYMYTVAGWGVGNGSLQLHFTMFLQVLKPL